MQTGRIGLWARPAVLAVGVLVPSPLIGMEPCMVQLRQGSEALTKLSWLR